MTAKSDIDCIRDTLKWAIGIMITLLIILITGVVRATASGEQKKVLVAQNGKILKLNEKTVIFH